MSKSKSAGKTKQKTPRPGKRRGVKRYGNQIVSPGEIIIRQVGSRFHPGEGTRMGRDFTIFAVRRGRVKFLRRQGKKVVAVF